MCFMHALRPPLAGTLLSPVQVHKQQLPVQEAAAKLGAEFHLPGHIFLCQENPKGLLVRR
jgi:3,4-dihydroxy-2-butanone 4-phosphate synthase